jgi:hypothetical protein
LSRWVSVSSWVWFRWVASCSARRRSWAAIPGH